MTRKITPEVREKGRQVKQMTALFDRYVLSLDPKSKAKGRKRMERINHLRALLDAGEEIKACPVFEGRRRVGTEERMQPLLPADKAKYMAEISRLERKQAEDVDHTLRLRFLEMLPDFADRKEYSREVLLFAGVPAADLDEVGLD